LGESNSLIAVRREIDRGDVFNKQQLRLGEILNRDVITY
jgi:hypothetical protein